MINHYQLIIVTSTEDVSTEADKLLELLFDSVIIWLLINWNDKKKEMKKEREERKKEKKKGRKKKVNT